MKLPLRRSKHSNWFFVFLKIGGFLSCIADDSHDAEVTTFDTINVSEVTFFEKIYDGEPILPFSLLKGLSYEIDFENVAKN
jgi:hypothetical protein